MSGFARGRRIASETRNRKATNNGNVKRPRRNGNAGWEKVGNSDSNPLSLDLRFEIAVDRTKTAPVGKSGVAGG